MQQITVEPSRKAHSERPQIEGVFRFTSDFDWLFEYKGVRFQEKGITPHWGDITSKDDLEQAMQNADAVIHLAGIVPPLSEDNQPLAHSVNTKGTQHIIELMENSPSTKRLPPIRTQAKILNGKNLVK